MSRKASPRPAPTALSKSIDRNLRVYSSAALAAGVSMLALGQPALGEVVVTKKTILIPVNPQNGSGPAAIDFNHDGIQDFLAAIYYSAYPFSDHSLRIFPPHGGGAIVASQNNNYASALVRGAKIGPSAHFSATTNNKPIEIVDGRDSSSGTYTRTLRGNWGGNLRNRFLGVRFQIKGKTHYGWIRLTVITDPRGMSATITGYAYETVPNNEDYGGATASSASQTKAQNHTRKPDVASLGTLALGADGLALWRRKEDLAVPDGRTL